MARQALLHLVRGYQQSSLGTPPPHQVSASGHPCRGRGGACDTSVYRNACCSHRLSSLEMPSGLQFSPGLQSHDLSPFPWSPRMSLRLHAVTPAGMDATARSKAWAQIQGACDCITWLTCGRCAC